MLSGPSQPLPALLSAEGKKYAVSAYGVWLEGLSVLKEGQFSSRALSFSSYLRVFKVVMVAAGCVCWTDLCTWLQFIGWRTDKWIPPSPADPNVSHCKKLKVTGLTWASFPGNNSFSPSFYPSFLSAREVLNVTVHPLPPATNSQQSFSPRPAQPPTFPYIC